MEEKQPQTNEQKYLEIVTNNPAAFDTWTLLLQIIEQNAK